ncbi:hypothetical protein ILUMI_15828 [Ignelater luminosus]|uniref:Peptidase aspartic putative domain-containing protein n=1 Tax=Ignelater luminosus TaxID=2038154 RepID=A0A8K0CMY5_IGNLU|nr:hypothetical protein ILUMI_15828 [Ignelater luminosus]
MREFQIPPNIELADRTFYQPGPINIGANLFWELLCIGQIKRNNQPLLQKTKLGWILSSGCEVSNSEEQPKQSACLALHELYKNVERLWKADQVVTIKNKNSIDEEYCQDLFQQTTTRSEDGRFIVRIPFKVNPDKHLESSSNKAVLRFQWLKTKLSKSEDLKLQYSEFIQEYIRLKHMSPSELNISKSFFLVSETTKLRVVFDG